MRVSRFHAWVTGYYAHDFGAEVKLSFAGAVGDTSVDRELVWDAPGLEPDGSDALVAKACERAKVYAPMREMALYEKGGSDEGQGEDMGWREVELRVVWCERSIWPAVWAGCSFQAEIAEAQRTGKEVRRPVSIARVKDANHFVSASRHVSVRGLTTCGGAI